MFVSKIASPSQGSHWSLHGSLPQEGVKVAGLEWGGWKEEERGFYVHVDAGWGLIHSHSFYHSLLVGHWRCWEPLYSLIHVIAVKINVLRTRWCLGQSAVKATCVHTGL